MHLQSLNDLQDSYVITRHHRYWSAQSQAYAAADQLLRYLLEGWQVDRRVEVESHWFGDARHIVIYHVVLSHSDRRLPMRVLGTPFVQDMLDHDSADFELVQVRSTRQRIRLDPVSADRSANSGIRA